MKRAWLGIALVFTLFEGAVYGVASWAERSSVWIYMDLPQDVLVDAPDDKPLLLDADEVRGSYANSWRRIALYSGGGALLHWNSSCPYGGSDLSDRCTWSLDADHVRVTNSVSNEVAVFRVVSCAGRPALRDEQGELYRPSR